MSKEFKWMVTTWTFPSVCQSKSPLFPISSASHIREQTSEPTYRNVGIRIRLGESFVFDRGACGIENEGCGPRWVYPFEVCQNAEPVRELKLSVERNESEFEYFQETLSKFQKRHKIRKVTEFAPVSRPLPAPTPQLPELYDLTTADINEKTNSPDLADVPAYIAPPPASPSTQVIDLTQGEFISGYVELDAGPSSDIQWLV